jgi:glycoside/pentoside/hexuronide:cation symporter, GPH family
LLPVFLVLNTIGTAAGIGAMIMGASMMSDVVEASEERTGRREEGLFFAGLLFIQKCASGLGIFIAGLILSVARFPENAQAGAVPESVLDSYTLLLVIANLVFAGCAALAFMRFPFGREEHEARLAKLAVAAAANTTGPAGKA